MLKYLTRFCHGQKENFSYFVQHAYRTSIFEQHRIVVKGDELEGQLSTVTGGLSLVYQRLQWRPAPRRWFFAP